MAFVRRKNSLLWFPGILHLSNAGEGAVAIPARGVGGTILDSLFGIEDNGDDLLLPEPPIATQCIAIPTKWLYEPDLTQQSVFAITQSNVSTRLTWQAAPRHKITGYYDTQTRDWDDNVVNVSPEAITMWRFPRLGLTQASWTSPLTNRLLLEARAQLKTESFYDLYNRENPIYKIDDPGHRAVDRPLLPRADRHSSRRSTAAPIRTCGRSRASMSYVTGAHAIKVGITDTWAARPAATRDNDYPMDLPVQQRHPEPADAARARRPRAVDPEGRAGHLRPGQVDDQPADAERRPPLRLPRRLLPGAPPRAGLFVPNRDITFPHEDSHQWKDISPRVGARLRPVRQRQDRAQGEHRPLRAGVGRRRCNSPIGPRGQHRHAYVDRRQPRTSARIATCSTCRPTANAA